MVSNYIIQALSSLQKKHQFWNLLHVYYLFKLLILEQDKLNY